MPTLVDKMPAGLTELHGEHEDESEATNSVAR